MQFEDRTTISRDGTNPDFRFFRIESESEYFFSNRIESESNIESYKIAIFFCFTLIYVCTDVNHRVFLYFQIILVKEEN